MGNLCLPTYIDVYRHFLSVYDGKKNINSAINLTCDAVICIWNSASLPCFNHKVVFVKLRRYITVVMKMKKGMFMPHFNKAYQSHMQKYSKLFDIYIYICTCRCDFESVRSCSCKRDDRIPPIELSYIKDQRQERKLYIDPATTEHTSIQSRKKHQLSHDVPSTIAIYNSTNENPSDKESCEEKIINYFDDNSSDPEFFYDEDLPLIRTAHQYYERIIAQADRYGISPIPLAAVINGFMEDIGMVSKENRHRLIDRNVIIVQRARYRSENRVLHYNIGGLYFDGKKDQTLQMSGKLLVEEHVTLLNEPGGQFISHVVASNSSGESVSSSIINELQPEELDALKVIGSDGTCTNTGANKGVITRIEAHLNRKLHWNICLLHLNELPLRHIVSEIDGKTTGPNVYEGPIGKSLASCHEKPPIDFLQIVLPQEFVRSLESAEDISSDQRYLRDILLAIHHKDISLSLAERSPGKLGNARWLTTANRILRHYVTVACPSPNLSIITRFTIFVYARAWFEIKKNCQFTFAPLHIFNIIQRTAALNDSHISEIYYRVLQTNSFSPHSENMLCSMLTDPRSEIIMKAVSKILYIRQYSSANNFKKKFKKPKINFLADDYYELISDEEWLESILTSHFSNNYLSNITLSSVKQFTFPFYPCHSQAVERHIRLVSESSKKIASHEDRNSRISTTLTHRKMMPKFRSKQDYVFTVK